METTAKNRYRYPWHDGNHFELLVDGRRFFPAMLEAIRNARHYILLELYLFESGQVANRFIDALTEATTRGVTVSLLLDDFGAMKLQRGDRQRLVDAGAELLFYNPLHYGKFRRNLFRDHRKLLLIDGRIAYTGGAGITDEFDGPPGRGWHDVVLGISGPVVADWQALFLQNRSYWTESPLTLPPAEPLFTSGGAPGRVVLNDPTRMELKRSLIKRIRGAERRVWLATAYFIPSWKIRRQLRKAVRRGADVRLLLPGPHIDHPAVYHAGRRFYSGLLRNGVRIFEYQPRFLHAKILLCDEWVTIGSSNIDRWNMRWNLEANQELESEHMADSCQQLFEVDFAQSREIHYEAWRRRPWYRRLQEWFWGVIDLWLERRG